MTIQIWQKWQDRSIAILNDRHLLLCAWFFPLNCSRISWQRKPFIMKRLLRVPAVDDLQVNSFGFIPQQCMSMTLQADVLQWRKHKVQVLLHLPGIDGALKGREGPTHLLHEQLVRIQAGWTRIALRHVSQGQLCIHWFK